MPIIAAKARSPEPVTNNMIIQIGLSVGHHKNLPDSAPCSSGAQLSASVVQWVRVGRSLDKRRSLMPSGRRYSINCVLASGNPHMLCRPSMCYNLPMSYIVQLYSKKRLVAHMWIVDALSICCSSKASLPLLWTGNRTLHATPLDWPTTVFLAAQPLDTRSIVRQLR
jgi:hypothetical protein